MFLYFCQICQICLQWKLQTSVLQISNDLELFPELKFRTSEKLKILSVCSPLCFCYTLHWLVIGDDVIPKEVPVWPYKTQYRQLIRAMHHCNSVVTTHIQVRWEVTFSQGIGRVPWPLIQGPFWVERVRYCHWSCPKSYSRSNCGERRGCPSQVTGQGYPFPSNRTGTSSLSPDRTGEDICPPPPHQHTPRTGYAAGSSLLAITQEDFLVFISMFCGANSSGINVKFKEPTCFVQPVQPVSSHRWHTCTS